MSRHFFVIGKLLTAEDAKSGEKCRESKSCYEYCFKESAVLWNQAEYIETRSPPANLCGFLCRQWCHGDPLSVRNDDPHLFPVVREFFAAIEADDIGAGNAGCRAAPAFLHRDRKAIVFVPATEKRVQNPGKHPSTPTETPRPEPGRRTGIYLH